MRCASAAETARADFIQAMDDDFNTARPLPPSSNWCAPSTQPAARRDGAILRKRRNATLRELGGVLGVGFTAPAAAPVQDVAATPFIDLLITVRGEFRGMKQWALADQIRDRLNELGVAIDDTPDGAQWRFEEQ